LWHVVTWIVFQIVRFQESHAVWHWHSEEGLLQLRAGSSATGLALLPCPSAFGRCCVVVLQCCRELLGSCLVSLWWVLRWCQRRVVWWFSITICYVLVLFFKYMMLSRLQILSGLPLLVVSSKNLENWKHTIWGTAWKDGWTVGRCAMMCCSSSVSTESPLSLHWVSSLHHVSLVLWSILLQCPACAGRMLWYVCHIGTISGGWKSSWSWPAHAVIRFVESP
jgi:hypothetical protein